MRALLRWLRLPRARQSLLFETAWALALAAWQVRTWRFARLSATLGRLAQPSPVEAQRTLDAGQLESARQVRSAVAAWLRAFPVRPTCLMCAIAAQRLLIKRGVASQLYFGVRGRGANIAATDSAIAAHAWLRCGSLVVTGEKEAATFQAIAVYRWESGHLDGS